MNHVFEKSKRLISMFLVLIVFVIFFSPLLAKKAEAQWVVWDPGNFVPNSVTAVNTGITAASYTSKEFGLDSVMWVLVNLIIERISASTVQWINSGFKGSPAFVTDPAAYFQDIGDKVAGQFIFSNPDLKFLCGPIQGKIKIALSNTYRGNNTSWRCSLTDVVGNMEDFINDFERGGWDKFFRITQESQNNPVGAYIQAEGSLAQQLAKKADITTKDLSWGQGFLSFKKCPDNLTVTDSEDDRFLVEEFGYKVGDCTGTEKTQTPGSIIQNSLSNVLNIGNNKLAVADEFNEIVSALLNQLVSKAIKGLASLNKPDPANNNSTFIDQLNNSTAAETADYFGTRQNTQLGETIIDSIQTPTGETPANPIYPNGSNSGTFIRTSCDPNTETCEATTVSGSRSR